MSDRLRGRPPLRLEAARQAFAVLSLDRAAAMFAIRNLIAILLALFIAFSLDLPRPYWSMLTIFIVAQPYSGSVRSRAVYRLGGTLLGAAFAVLVTPRLSTTPELLCVALAAWLGAGLFLSLLDRSPRGYVFMLAGYTAAIVVFSNVDAPGSIFETAVARVEEISVGIICVAVVHSVAWPREITPALHARIAQALADADRWLAEVLAGEGVGEAAAERRRLAADISELHVLSHHLDFDTARIRPTRRSLRALLDRLSTLQPLAAALEDRLAALNAAGGADEPLVQLVADAEAWLRCGRAGPEAAAELRARALTLEAVFQAGRPDWRGLLHASAAARLGELVQVVEESQALAALLQARGDRLPRTVLSRLPRETRRPLHIDPGLAAGSALVAALVLLGVCAFWILTGWPDGGGAAVFAAIGACLFATQDDPTPSVTTLGLYVALAVPLAAAYQFLILPAIDGFVMLGAVLAPAILAISYFLGRPSTNLRALALSLGFVSGIPLQSRYGADFAASLNADLAPPLGLVFALIALRAGRVIDTQWSGARIVRRGWRQIAAMARAPRPADGGAWLSLAVDRLGLVASRLSPHDEDAGRIGTSDALRDVQVGLEVIELQRLRLAASPALRAQLDRLLRDVASVFARRRPGMAAAPGPLAPVIDRALATCVAEANGEPRRIGVGALVGLRRNLFPAGEDYEGEPA
ncbi:MAG TPA: FUSC family protein [Caulobacteraceae bacterium]|jgi:uncharacterized membrane protein YccC